METACSIETFLKKHCGLASPELRCRCTKLVPAAVAGGLVDPKRLTMRSLPTTRADRLRTDIEEIRTAAEVFRSLPSYGAPTDFAARVRSWTAGDDTN